MDLGNGLGHLTYSTLVHPADDWPQLWNSLNTYLPKVKARFAGNKSFGVCIRLSAKTAEMLAASAAARDAFERVGLDRLVAVARKENAPSLRIMEKIGMTYDRNHIHRGIPVLLYSMTKSHWRSLP